MDVRENVSQLPPVPTPTGEHTHKLYICPDLESNLQTFGLWPNPLTNWATQPGLCYFLCEKPLPFVNFCYYCFCPHSRTSLLILDREGRRRKRERNIDVRQKHWLVVSWTCPNQRPKPQLRFGPWLGIKPMTFWLTGRYSHQLSHTSQGFAINF